MPVHDWTRVGPHRFHDFHQSWTIALRNALNAGLLPPDYFAMVEQKAGPPEPDAITIELTLPASSEAEGYARKANRITVRHPRAGVVAVVEIVSPGDKDSRQALRNFTHRVVNFLKAGVHLLIVDLFPPGPRDPQGIHPLIWAHKSDEPFRLPLDKPLTMAAYTAGTELAAYIEPVAVGDPLLDMPVFLTADAYVACPLEAAYQTAWEQFPAPLRRPLEEPPP
jgi:hypothetical protein